MNLCPITVLPNESHEVGCVLRYRTRWNYDGVCSCRKRKLPEEREDPKHIQAMKDGKIPMEYLVYSVLEDDARCHKHGADKYGVRNWLKDKIRATTYLGAMLRHLFAWACGQDLDPDTGLPHLTHLRACCAIVLDAGKHGTLIDDRNRVETKDKTEGEQNDN